VNDTTTTWASKNVTYFFTNAQSIANKFAELQAAVKQHCPKVIGIAETWCSDNISDAELHLQGYDLFRDDRLTGVGGGVALYVHSDRVLYHAQF